MDYDDCPDEEWVEDEGNLEDDVLACPSCGSTVHEDTQQCPYCGDWIIPVSPEGRSKRIIWIVAAILLIIALILLTVR